MYQKLCRWSRRTGHLFKPQKKSSWETAKQSIRTRLCQVEGKFIFMGKIPNSKAKTVYGNRCPAQRGTDMLASWVEPKRSPDTEQFMGDRPCQRGPGRRRDSATVGQEGQFMGTKPETVCGLFTGCLDEQTMGNRSCQAEDLSDDEVPLQRYVLRLARRKAGEVNVGVRPMHGDGNCFFRAVVQHIDDPHHTKRYTKSGLPWGKEAREDEEWWQRRQAVAQLRTHPGDKVFDKGLGRVPQTNGPIRRVRRSTHHRSSVPSS